MVFNSTGIFSPVKFIFEEQMMAKVLLFNIRNADKLMKVRIAA